MRQDGMLLPHLRTVAILHDDMTKLTGKIGSDAHVGVWTSIRSIEKSIRNLGVRVRRVSCGRGLTAVRRVLSRNRPDAAFHLAETVRGRTIGEAEVAGMLERLKIPHTSTSSDNLALCRDKVLTKRKLKSSGVLTPDFSVSAQGRLPARLPPPPWIAKPCFEDGSIGIDDERAVTGEVAELDIRLSALHRQFRQPVLIETFIAGREFAVGIVGRQVLPLAEIDFSGLPAHLPRIVGYHSKWTTESVYYTGSKTVCPADVSRQLGRKIENAGLAALRVAGATGYARVDMRVDRSGRPYVLEINPNPDLSPGSGMVKMAAAAGWNYDDLVSSILKMAINGNGCDHV